MNNHDIAAHKIAEHLRAIAVLLAEASEDAWRAYCPGSERIKPEYLEMLITKAAAIEATAPFEPVSDERKQEIFEQVIEEVSDLSTKDIARNFLDLTEAMWRVESDEREEMENE